MRLSQRGGGGYQFPCSPEINGLFPCSSKNKILILYVPLIFGPLFPCSPEKYALVPLFPKIPGRASQIKSRQVIKDLDQNLFIRHTVISEHKMLFPLNVVRQSFHCILNTHMCFIVKQRYLYLKYRYLYFKYRQLHY